MTQLINSFRFAEISDIVFSEDLTIEQFNKKELSNIHILEKSKRVKYINLEFVLNEGDIVFCNTEHVKLLFKLLKNNTEHKNLILITSQSDIEIDSSLLNKLPKCFSKWFCINSKINEGKLTNIPLGVANDYEKNLLESEINYSPENFFKSKKYLLFVNFNVNTNRKVRKPLYEHFKNVDNFLVTEYNSDKNNYKNNLINSNFVLCPEGNGLETHRFWETLYCGSIPVVRNFSGYEGFKDLPILFVHNFEDLNSKVLKDYLNNLQEVGTNLDSLDFEYWKNLIISSKQRKEEENSHNLIIKINSSTLKYYLLLNNLYVIKNKFYKFINKKYWQIKKLVMYLNKS